MPKKRSAYNHTCEQCGDSFTSSNKVQKFCSTVCSGKASRGGNNSRFKGGCVSRGYRIVYANGRRVLEHRYVMEQVIGRPLSASEVIHHRDGNGLNNDPSNLHLYDTNADHMTHHFRWFRDATSKQCRLCHEVKPRLEFYPVPPGKMTPKCDPHRSECKVCYQQYEALRRERKKEASHITPPSLSSCLPGEGPSPRTASATGPPSGACAEHAPKPSRLPGPSERGPCMSPDRRRP